MICADLFAQSVLLLGWYISFEKVKEIVRKGGTWIVQRWCLLLLYIDGKKLYSPMICKYVEVFVRVEESLHGFGD